MLVPSAIILNFADLWPIYAGESLFVGRHRYSIQV